MGMVQLTPTPKIQNKPMTMSFFDAIKAIQNGNSVRRIEWNNLDYCFMGKDEFLSIYTKGKIHQWLINLGDIEGNDWMIVKQLN